MLYDNNIVWKAHLKHLCAFLFSMSLLFKTHIATTHTFQNISGLHFDIQGQESAVFVWMWSLMQSKIAVLRLWNVETLVYKANRFLTLKYKPMWQLHPYTGLLIIMLQLWTRVTRHKTIESVVHNHTTGQ